MIRLFNTETGEQISELRRGSESAIIRHLSFEPEKGAYISCTSDKNTIHIFKAPVIGSKSDQNSQDASQSGNTKSYFSALSSMVSIAGSEWSFAQLRLDPAA